MKNALTDEIKNEQDLILLRAGKAQNLASHPQHSAWVSASAGTGKTKVLTDRVLRLLLPREDGRSGAAAHKIVCLTYTKAAANEMAVRITQRLGSWAVMDIGDQRGDGGLVDELEGLLGYVPGDVHIKAARRLFAEVVDSPAGLQIMTIHAFCQSVLGRFPVEAGISPDFSVLDERQARSILAQAQALVFDYAFSDEQGGSALSIALHNLSVYLSPDALTLQIASVCKEKNQFLSLLNHYKSVEGLYSQICLFYNIYPDADPEHIVRDFCKNTESSSESLRYAAQLLYEDGGVTAQKNAQEIFDFLAGDVDHRVKALPSYKLVYLTKEGKLRSRGLPPASIDKKDTGVRSILCAEADRLIAMEETLRRTQSAAMTRDLFYVAQQVIQYYETLKHKNGGLDYDDLINRTLALFTGSTHVFQTMDELSRVQVLPWVLYKLDQGIDHILIDEAQDTNPEQWKIMETISDEFFSGHGSKEQTERTYFVVGDIKQSIYGFQRAAPKEFKRMNKVFDEKIRNADLINHIVPLDVSFRSSESVLRVVDSVFDQDDYRSALGEDVITHKVFRQGQEGVVEVWPVFETQKAEKRDPWEPMVHSNIHGSGAEDMSRLIAHKIKNWLLRKEWLASRGRAIEPEDIMILVRSRAGVVKPLIRALKAQGIPVSGVDRMIVGEQLAVQDLLALAHFCLLPEDDLTLAEVLKSPFIGLDEEELFLLCYGRTGSLWNELCRFDQDRLKGFESLVQSLDFKKIESVRAYLSIMIQRAQTLNSYEFFSAILNESCPADSYSGLRAICRRLGEEANDPIEELLNAALNFTYSREDHLQCFLDEQGGTRTELKREMEDAGNKVRIMTIHGSKGLQSPVVILPDTMPKRTQHNNDNVLWPAKTGAPVPLFSPKVEMEPEAYTLIKQKKKLEDEEEQQRLLYVAMTRAAERLYVTGYSGEKKSKSSSWYEQIRNAVENEDGVQKIMHDYGEILRLSNPQSQEPDKYKKVLEYKTEESNIASWVFSLPREEPVPPKPLIPSRPSLEDELDDRARSPLSVSDPSMFVRGNIVHKLLEFLPNYPKAQQKELAAMFVQKKASSLQQDVRDKIVQDVCAILTHPDYQNFFQAGSLAEVPVTALMPDHKIISGQIDRLVVGESDVWIVDYKTNRSVPLTVADVPRIYLDQLKAYKDVIGRIYPDHRVYTALLWTEEPLLMRVDV
ncbi:MAG: double-strand break repair helicase AddA [Alphaproteobacteria bacterium]